MRDAEVTRVPYDYLVLTANIHLRLSLYHLPIIS